MANIRPNSLDPDLDIHGSLQQTSDLQLSDEPNLLGAPVAGQTGSVAQISSASGGNATLTGLTGMSANSVGRYLTISNSSNPGNNGTFRIVTYNSSTSVTIENASAISPDTLLTWVERNPYRLSDDLNYNRTDRAAIKGVGYAANIPTYTRPTNASANIPANLSNLAGKTTDAKALSVTRVYRNQAVSAGNTKVTISSTGNLKHSNTVDATGVPCFDVAPFLGDFESCYVEVRDVASGSEIEVKSGPHLGERVIGLTTSGASASPNSVEVVFYSVAIGGNLNTVSSYTWESGQPNSVNLFYGYNQRIDQLDQNALRSDAVLGLLAESFTGASTANYDFLLDNEPDSFNNTYSNTFTLGVVTQEKWKNTSTNATIKTIDYTYSGGNVSQERRKVYDSSGITVVAQLTLTYTYTLGSVSSITATRDI